MFQNHRKKVTHLDTLIEILKLVGISSIISGIFSLVLQRSLRARDARQEELRLQNEQMEAQNKALMGSVMKLKIRCLKERGFSFLSLMQNSLITILWSCSAEK